MEEPGSPEIQFGCSVLCKKNETYGNASDPESMGLSQMAAHRMPLLSPDVPPSCLPADAPIPSIPAARKSKSVNPQIQIQGMLGFAVAPREFADPEFPAQI